MNEEENERVSKAMSETQEQEAAQEVVCRESMYPEPRPGSSSPFPKAEHSWD
jgi:hypothetical protein